MYPKNSEMHFSSPIAALAIFAAAISVESALINSSITTQLKIYKERVNKLYQMLQSECPNEVAKRDLIVKSLSDVKSTSTLLNLEKFLLNEIVQRLVRCREEKSKSKASPTTNTTTASSSPSTSKPTVTPAPTTATPHPECPHAMGYSKMSVDLVSYRNPSNAKANGGACDAKEGLTCAVYLEICISGIGERSCSFRNLMTDVVGNSPFITFTSDVGGSDNPFTVDLGERQWEGINIIITVWHSNSNKKTDDLVDEFSYDTINSPGSPTLNVNLLSSVYKLPKSSLQIGIRTHCASATTTTPANSRTTPTTATTIPTTATTTPTTAATTITTKPTMTTTMLKTTTTLSPEQKICISATNLTEAWRRDSSGSNFMPVKTNGGYNCDPTAMVAQGRPWFRFAGAAGNRLLNRCPPRNSCGTQQGLWSDDPMPTAVGVVDKISVSQAQTGDAATCRPFSSITQVSVMRCSTRQHDFIYRYDGARGCNWGFCGMS